MGIANGQSTTQIGIRLDAAEPPSLLQFYKSIFCAEETYSLGGTSVIGVRFAGTHFTIIRSEHEIDNLARHPMIVYVQNVDQTISHALKLGAQWIPLRGTSGDKPVTYLPDGDRAARFRDPDGHAWEVRTCLDVVPPDEALRRAKRRTVR